MPRSIDMGGRRLAPDSPCLVIAEAGVNHNGDPDIAETLVLAAQKCGADCVKFQTFRAEDLVTEQSPKVPYQRATTDAGESQLAMLQRLELSPASHRRVFDKCGELEIEFLSTPYGALDADFLDGLGVSAFKVASGQLVELDFLAHVARKGKPILLSTGMASLGEVEAAVGAIRGAGNDEIVLLQCTTNYPSQIEDANLRAMKTMENAFGTLVGYSDHTTGTAAAVAAVALGAVVIEKHFTLNKALPGPDQSTSADPGEFENLVRLIRQAQLALGSASKQASAAELRNAPTMRRSIVAACDIRKGAVLTSAMLALKRPAFGLAPSWMSQVVGRVSACDIGEGSPLTLASVSWANSGAGA